MTSKEIRKKYLDFFYSKGHAVLPSASLIPENDSTTLFVSSGMQPLIPYLLGEKHPLGLRLVNSQKSFRADDIDEVGDGRHTTFFEMLGNWSLGDYFKKEQLPWIYEFLVEELGLEPKRLYATVFRGNPEIGIGKDAESVEILKSIFRSFGIEAHDVDFSEKNGLEGGRIFYYDEKKNWWSRSGVPQNMPVGEPGGPDSEIFYDLGENLKKHEHSPFSKFPCHVNCDCGRFIEIGNSVFMEYVRQEHGFESLPQKNVDFGGGLERMSMAVQGKENIFETDLFINIIRAVEEVSLKKYRENMKPFEIIADHLRAAVFIMGDDAGIAPSNVEQGYLVRRLIRRAVRYGRQLGISERFWMRRLAEIIIEDYQEVYGELERNKNFIFGQLQEEEEKFDKTLERGLKEFEKYYKKGVSKWEGNPDNARRNLNKEIDEQLGIIPGYVGFKLYTTYGFPIELIREIAKEKNLILDEKDFQEKFKEHQELSRTASAGKFRGGLADASEETKKLHTATHLLLAALRKVLGEHVHQKGSNITAERLRLDFSHPEKMTEEEKAEAERLVNEAIAKDLPVRCEEMTVDEAKSHGALGVFELKYGEKVKVYTIGNDQETFSKEICGGPHAERTGALGKFRILKEEASSAGVRRIKGAIEG